MHYHSYCEKDEFLMGCVANTVVALWSAASYAEDAPQVDIASKVCEL